MVMADGLRFDPSEKGLRKTLKEYQMLALRYLWDIGEEGAGSALVWKAVNEVLKKQGISISRTSVIWSLDNLVDQGVLRFELESGKGGMHRVYKPAMDECGYKKYVVKTILESVIRDFPEEARGVIKDYVK
jgi:predicted transcriptional regulator